jgi:2-C-methyl-D-erythritol 4-phosphate cytidylyltransferase
MRVAALVLAAGRGERLGAGQPKAFLPLVGRPLLVHAIEALAGCSRIDLVVPVLPAAEIARLADWCWSELAAGKLAAPVAGGAERQDSMRAGLAALPDDVELVAVHDAARPLVRAEDVARVVDAASQTGAALLAVPVRDTLKRVRDGLVVETPAREGLWAAQTPQVFRAALLREAIAKAEAEGFQGTDDAQIVERLGVPVAFVAGDPGNLKITWPADLGWAEAFLRERDGGDTR